MPTLVVSDANVIIDMEHGKLLEAFFALPFEICVPDLLYDEELEPHLGGLPELGLKTLTLTDHSVDYVAELSARPGSGPGFYDLTALALANQEGCLLLTGDKRLRALAKVEGIEVHGTVWVVENMLENELISLDAAEPAFDRMLEHNARLPRFAINEMLDRFRE